MKKKYNSTSSKTSKKTPSFYVVLFALIFTFIGSILGSVAFIQNIVDKDFENTESIINSYDTALTDNNSFSASTFDCYNINLINNNSNNNIELFDTIDNGRFLSSNLLYPLVSVNAVTGVYNAPSDIFYFDFGFGRNYDSNGNFDGTFSYSMLLSTYNNPLAIYSGVATDYKGSTNFNHLDGTVFNFNPNAYNYSSDGSYTQCIRFGTSNSSYKRQLYLKIYPFDNNGNLILLNGNITRIEISHQAVNWTSPQSRNYILPFSGENRQESYFFNTLRYYQGDNFDLVLEFGFLTYFDPTNSPFVLYEPRVYYTNGEFDSSNGDYRWGYDNGLIQGKQDGINIGREQGYKDGFADGKTEGYNQGLNSGNKNNFLSLLGAVFDAPITAIRGLLNFDLLGFNMFNFMTALLTIGLIIFVVRLFI